jgi:hypothetical protein
MATFRASRNVAPSEIDHTERTGSRVPLGRETDPPTWEGADDAGSCSHLTRE